MVMCGRRINLLWKGWRNMARKKPSKTHRVVRDAKTGRFLEKGTEERRPTTTTVETIKHSTRKQDIGVDTVAEPQDGA
jgi:hypothetical protein